MTDDEQTYYVKMTVARQVGNQLSYKFEEDPARRCFMELQHAKGPNQCTLADVEAYARTQLRISGAQIWVYEDRTARVSQRCEKRTTRPRRAPVHARVHVSLPPPEPPCGTRTVPLDTSCPSLRAGSDPPAG